MGQTLTVWRMLSPVSLSFCQFYLLKKITDVSLGERIERTTGESREALM
jgi:hypothetical protein